MPRPVPQAIKIDEALKPLNGMGSKLDRIAEALNARRAAFPTSSPPDTDNIDAGAGDQTNADATSGIVEDVGFGQPGPDTEPKTAAVQMVTSGKRAPSSNIRL